MQPLPESCWAANLANKQEVFSALCKALQGRVCADSDWEAVLTLANRTMVTPSLADALANTDDVPSDVREFVTAIAERTKRRNSAMRSQLAESCTALSDCGIAPVLIKGAAFLVSIAEGANARLSTDLDLVLPHEQKADALKALRGIGYQLAPSSISADAGINLQRSSDAGGLDIHYWLRSLDPQPDYETLRPYCRKADLDGAEILLPCRELQIVILVAHDQLQERDYWRGLIDLRHLLDLRNILRDGSKLDDNILTTFFPRGPARRALETQLLTLEAAFGVPPPDGIPAGRIARLQVRRRSWQMNRERAMPWLTAAALLQDPVLPGSAMNNRGKWRNGARFYRRIFAPPKATKV